MSTIKVIKGKTKNGEWIDIENPKFKLSEFIEVEIYEIITKQEFKERFSPGRIINLKNNN